MCRLSPRQYESASAASQIGHCIDVGPGRAGRAFNPLAERHSSSYPHFRQASSAAHELIIHIVISHHCHRLNGRWRLITTFCPRTPTAPTGPSLGRARPHIPANSFSCSTRCQFHRRRPTPFVTMFVRQPSPSPPPTSSLLRLASRQNSIISTHRVPLSSDLPSFVPSPLSLIDFFRPRTQSAESRVPIEYRVTDEERDIDTEPIGAEKPLNYRDEY